MQIAAFKGCRLQKASSTAGRDPPMSEPSESTLSYECPHCLKTVELSEKLLNETIECPQCGKPFQVQPPMARALNDSEEVGETADAREQSPIDDEETERVIHLVLFRHHFFGTFLCTLITLIGLAGLAMGLTGQALMGFEGLLLIIPSAVLLAISALYLLKWWVESRIQSLTLTSERLIYRSGIIRRNTSEMRHDDVRNLKVHQGFLERMLNYGDIAISSAGQSDMEIIMNDIPDPESVAEFVRKRQ
jgi:DNA-directed RNA polymerase subunit RPC12/RpoP